MPGLSVRRVHGASKQAASCGCSCYTSELQGQPTEVYKQLKLLPRRSWALHIKRAFIADIAPGRHAVL